MALNNEITCEYQFQLTSKIHFSTQVIYLKV